MTVDTSVLVDALPKPEFAEFPSISRLSRDMIVSEKIDGTNAQIHIAVDGRVFAGSRSRWIAPGDDNFGFARWVADHEDELRITLGYGTHYGEWWGAGIQRKYGLGEKRFSLFNTGRWHSLFNNAFGHERENLSTQCIEVPLCHVVPVIDQHTFDTERVDRALNILENFGSLASPGFMKPEGVVVFHVASNSLFKKTLDKHDGHKSAV